MSESTAQCVQTHDTPILNRNQVLTDDHHKSKPILNPKVNPNLIKYLTSSNIKSNRITDVTDLNYWVVHR